MHLGLYQKWYQYRHRYNPSHLGIKDLYAILLQFVVHKKD